MGSGQRPGRPVAWPRLESRLATAGIREVIGLGRAAAGAAMLSWTLWTAAAFAAPPEDQTEGREQQRTAVNRVAAAHDLTMITATARLVLRQAALRTAREHLWNLGRERNLGADWKLGDTHWNAAEAAMVRDSPPLITAAFADDLRLRNVWTEAAVTGLDGEEADVIASHFESDAGKEQLALMDWFLSETVLFRYTYTNQFQYDMPGAEAEQKELQRIAVPKIPRKDNELEFSKRNPEAFQFVACSPESRYCPGVKYVRLVAKKVSSELVVTIDGVLRRVVEAVEARKPEALAHVEAFLAQRRPPPAEPAAAPPADAR